MERSGGAEEEPGWGESEGCESPDEASGCAGRVCAPDNVRDLSLALLMVRIEETDARPTSSVTE